MHIEVFQQDSTPRPGQPSITNWHWHFRNKGRITADSEAFPSKNNASRAARAVVSAVVKELGGIVPVQFMHAEWVEDKKVWRIEWY